VPAPSTQLRCFFVIGLHLGSPASGKDRQRVGGPPGPGDEHGLKEETVASVAIGVQAECIVAVDELADVAREHGDEEEAHSEAEKVAAAAYDEQRRTERDLDETGQDDHDVLVDPDPIGHLGLEVVAGIRQVEEPGDDERDAEDGPCSGANTRESSGGHCPYRTGELRSHQSETIDHTQGSVTSSGEPAASRSSTLHYGSLARPRPALLGHDRRVRVAGACAGRALRSAHSGLSGCSDLRGLACPPARGRDVVGRSPADRCVRWRVV